MNLRAVFPPMTTPFDNNGEVDARAIRSNISRWMSAGLGGVVALGSNGEAALLDEHEADVVLDAARAAVPRDKVLVAGTARESTRATIAASRRAAAAGADAVLVRTPSAFKARMTADVIARHYTAVADASPIPVLLYNYPAATGVNLAVETVARLAEHPNIAGMKETGTDVAQLAAFVDATPERFAVMAGSAPPVYAFLCVGAVGAILAVACAAPEACVRLYDLTIAGRHADARELQRRLTPLAKMVTTGFGVPGLKAAMDLAGYVGGDPRAPLVSAAADAIAQIRAELDRLQEAGDIHSLTRQ
ncbi:MAG TPA: dihydrodipicolinate synthase family protein [Vicinamibacterales bacterium]|nr:dihydrodipicolinate synthase family protein [Vicinamibacterales bacterium]